MLPARTVGAQYDEPHRLWCLHLTIFSVVAAGYVTSCCLEVPFSSTAIQVRTPCSDDGSSEFNSLIQQRVELNPMKRR